MTIRIPGKLAQEYSVVCLALLLTLFAPAASAQGSKCPDTSSSETYEGSLPHGESVTIPINLLPCETLTISVVTDTHRYYGAFMELEYYNQEDGRTIRAAFDFWLAFGAGQLHRSPHGQLSWPWPGVVEPEDLPAYAEFKAAHGDVFSYTIVVSKVPRPGYNLGGQGFDDALDVSSLPSTFYGSLGEHLGVCPPPSRGQYFKIRLEGNQTISVSGFAAPYFPGYGAGFEIYVYKADRTLLWPDSCSGLLFIPAYGRGEDYFRLFTNPSPEPAVFYFLVRSHDMTRDFRMDLAPVSPPTCPLGPEGPCASVRVFDAQGFLRQGSQPARPLNSGSVEFMYRVHLLDDDPYNTTADGVSRLVIQLDLPISDTRNDVTFTINSGSVAADGGFAPDLNAQGQPALRVPFEDVGGGIKRAVAVYVPPGNFSWGSADETKRTRDVPFAVDYPGVRLGPIRLHRPPVVFVHGFTSGPRKWDEAMRVFRDLDGPYRGRDIWTVDWSSMNTSGLDKVFGMLPATINQALYQRRYPPDAGPRTATTKVDVVAHSMGGLITKWFISDFTGIANADRSDRFKRQVEVPVLGRGCNPIAYPRTCTITTTRPPEHVYLRDVAAGRDISNFGSGDIRRVITIGTPFAGSDLANRVLAQPLGSFAAVLADWRDSIWNGGGDLGAFDDLAVGSKALELLERAQRPPNAPPVYSIWATGDGDTRGLSDWRYLTELFGSAAYLRPNCSDRVVSNDSQKGSTGLSENYRNVNHASEPADGRIIQKALRLLTTVYGEGEIRLSQWTRPSLIDPCLP